MAWGGARKGAGRKPKPTDPPPEGRPQAEPPIGALPPELVAELADRHAGKSPEEIMDLSMRVMAALGDFRGAALAAARLAAAKARTKAPQSASGKKEAAHAAALDRAHGPSPFAVPPPPKTLN